MKSIKSFFSFLTIGMLFFVFTSCKEETSLPNVKTIFSHANTTSTSATCGGQILDDGNASIISKGVVWGRSIYPTVENNIGITDEGSGIAEFTSNISDLTPSTLYYVRAYAINSNGVGYGEQFSFTSLEEPWLAKHITNILIEDYTATWCGYCPRVHYAIKAVTEENENIHAMAIYEDSDKRYSNVNQMISIFNISGFPTAKVNRKSTWGYPENMNGLTSFLTAKSPLGIAIESSLSVSLATIKVEIEYAKNFYEDLKVVVCLTESKLIGSQANYYSDGLGNPIANFEHNHVLRKAATDIFGDLIPASETLKDNKSTRNYSMLLDGYVKDNCSIVVFVVNSNKEVLNVQEVKVGESKGFQYITKK